MRLKSLVSMMAVVGLVVGCAQQQTAAEAAKPAANDNLLFRVQFAGTTALLANTNAAYLTNFTALPETAAMNTQIVARLASLPARLLASSQTNGPAELLQPVFAGMLRGGFTLELRGGNGVVTDFALAAKADTETARSWGSAWKSAATNWPAATKLAVKNSGDWLFVAGSRTDPAAALGAIQKSAAGVALEAGAVLQGELASSLLPGPVQRSVYGRFERIKLSVTPTDQTLKIRGTATYASDLPKLGPAPTVPTNLVTEPAISFTMVREPGAWLEPKSALRRFLPSPIPDVAYFWGGQTSPYQLSMAMPFAGRDYFNTNFGPYLRDQFLPVIKFIDFGSVTLDTNDAQLKALTIPFVDPKVMVKQDGTNNFLVAESFLTTDLGPCLTPALIERVSGRTNLLLYDWEFTQLRMDTWLRIGGLALYASRHQQNIAATATLKWLLAWQAQTDKALNTSTEITQSGPRELTLKRSAPVAFTSLELFWLANWLESTNFPAANFLVPATE